VRWARAGLVVVAVVLVVGALAALLFPPGLDTFSSVSATLRDTGDRLPAGVELDLAVRASVGPWMTLVAAGLVTVGALGSREA
jgi:hypothetical protein